jgi:trehalose synthase
MLQQVAVGRWSLDSYREVVPQHILDELHEHARALKGARILHINATAYGGGVSELLRSCVPLLRDRGGSSPRSRASTHGRTRWG